MGDLVDLESECVNHVAIIGQNKIRIGDLRHVNDAVVPGQDEVGITDSGYINHVRGVFQVRMESE